MRVNSAGVALAFSIVRDSLRKDLPITTCKFTALIAVSDANPSNEAAVRAPKVYDRDKFISEVMMSCVFLCDRMSRSAFLNAIALAHRIALSVITLRTIAG